VRVRTSVGRIWLPEASRCSFGWVSCFQLCLSACSRDVYCICRPPTKPSPPSLLLRFVWSCLPPRCIHTLVLCFICGPLSLDSLGDHLPHLRRCQCVLGPSGFLSLCRLRGESLRSGLSTWVVAALAQVPGAPFVEWLLGVAEDSYLRHCVCLQCVTFLY
jgi:hypothetical protein